MDTAQVRGPSLPQMQVALLGSGTAKEKMIIQRAHKIRLCPNNKQANYFVRACGCARKAFNWGLDQWQKQYEAGEKPSAYALKKQFNSIKRDEFPFVYEVTKCATEGGEE